VIQKIVILIGFNILHSFIEKSESFARKFNRENTEEREEKRGNIVLDVMRKVAAAV
jgi:hypothetical protein